MMLVYNRYPNYWELKDKYLNLIIFCLIPYMNLKLAQNNITLKFKGSKKLVFLIFFFLILWLSNATIIKINPRWEKAQILKIRFLIILSYNAKLDLLISAVTM